MAEKVYTPEEAAAHLKLRPVSIRKMLRTGSLKGFKSNPAGSGRWLIPDSFLQDFIDGRKAELFKNEQ